MLQRIEKKINKENLAQWAYLAFKKALTIHNIRIDFRPCGIWPLNFKVIKEKMELSKGFCTQSSKDNQYDVLIQKI